MDGKNYRRLCPARPSEVRALGPNLVDQLLDVEKRLVGPEQFTEKKKVIAHFEKNEPDLFSFFRTKRITPYQFLVRVQKAFRRQTDVVFDDYILTKDDAVTTLKRYIPNLQYLHDNQLYTNWDTLKELGASVAVGVVFTGIAEAIGRQTGSNPYLSMELAVTLTSAIALAAFLWFVVTRNRSIFRKAPWDSAIYLAANLYESNPDNWKSITWPEMEQPFNLSKGFTLLKNRPHYEALDAFYANSSKGQ